MEYAAELAPICELVSAGAALRLNSRRRKAAGSPLTSTWAEFLGDLNFGDSAFLIRQIDWWLRTIKARQSAMLIGDFSPIAVLAAKIAGIPSVSVGTGYSVPPPGMDEFPVLLSEINTRIYRESAVLAAVNEAMLHFGASPVMRLSDIYAGSLQM